jgi:hypothetical protein
MRELNRALTDLRDALDDIVFEDHPGKADQRIYQPGPWREAT